MHDIAPARVATDGDVWTSDGVVMPWHPPTPTDDVILVSVTGSDTALEEFPSELEAFPSEQAERIHASPANSAEFPFEDGNLEDLFAAESPPTLATEPTPAVAAAPTSTDLFAVEPTPTVAVVVPAIARATTPDQPEVSRRAVRTARPRALLVDPPIATHAGTQSVFFSARPGRSYRGVIGAGAAAALLFVTAATAVTVGWHRVSLFHPDVATAKPEPTVPLPAAATIRTATEYPAIPASTEDAGRLSGAPPSNDASTEESLAAVSAPAPSQREPSRAAATSSANYQPDAPVRSEPSLSATASVASSRVAVPPTAYVKPAEPIVSAPQFVAAEPIVPTLLSPRPPVANAVPTPSAAESTPPIAATAPAIAAVAPAALAGETSTTTSRVAADSSAVQDVLGRYRTAFSGLNAGAAASVWPTVDAKALGKAFERLETQEIEFDRCDVVVTGARAVATCGGRARYVPKVGNKSAHVESRQWRFDLRKLNERWLIDAVSAR